MDQVSGEKTAADLAEENMRERHEESGKTPAGSAGWTEPRARTLTEEDWLNAIAKDPKLMKIHRDVDLSQTALQLAQEPSPQTTESRFNFR